MSALPTAAPGVGPGTQVPELLAAFPACRAVLDRHGLRGCGGASGPPESLEVFARAHGVPLPSLLEELRAASRDGAAAPAAAARPEDAIHRGFFRAAILVTLTAGATWGAGLLFRIATAGDFRAATVAEINAHGHAQIAGWLGLFAMGFACQAFPRFLGLDLPWPRLARATLPLMVAGILARVAGEAFVGGTAGLALGVAAAVLETAAAAAFAAVIFRTLSLAGDRARPLALWVRPALLWFTAAMAGEGALFVATATATTPAELVSRVATWQPILRDAELHGFALLLVLGVACRYLPAVLGLPAPGRRATVAMLALVAAAPILEIAGWLGYRVGGVRSLVMLAWAGAVLVVPAALIAARGFGVFRPAPERHRGLPFVRTAFAWLILASLMLVALPFYARGMGMGFSHAWAGAARHALTVGFLSMMIVGVAAKVVPTLEGVDPRSLPSLAPVFVLLNAGCLSRVTFQVLSDAHPWAFRAAGVSGFLEVTALALWAFPLLRAMAGRLPAAGRMAAGPAAPAPDRVDADSFVLDVVERSPAALGVLVGHGLTPLANPVFRATVARGVTLRRAAAIAGVPVESLVEEIRLARR